MAMINLSELNINYYKEDHSYYDHGSVPDVEHHARIIYQSYTKREDSKKAIFGDSTGKHYHAMYMGFLLLGDRFHWHTFYEETEDNISNIFQRGHEQGHIAHATGKTDLLAKATGLRRLNRLFEHHRNYDTCSEQQRELIANISGLTALRLKGYRLENFPTERFHPNLRQAMSLINRAYFTDQFPERFVREF